jgi:hypothetical protein
MTVSTCALCTYTGLVTGPQGQFQRICRRYPPQLTTLVLPTQQGPSVQTVTAWPLVADGDHCGEFKSELGVGN